MSSSLTEQPWTKYDAEQDAHALLAEELAEAKQKRLTGEIVIRIPMKDGGVCQEMKSCREQLRPRKHR